MNRIVITETDLATVHAELACNKYRQVAALCVIRCAKTGNVVVVKRSKDNQIGFPCGKVDSGEVVLRAAYRELHEETGISRDKLDTQLRYIGNHMLNGTLVNIYEGLVKDVVDLKPLAGFETETTPMWVSPEYLISAESRFRAFNILAMLKAHVVGRQPMELISGR